MNLSAQAYIHSNGTTYPKNSLFNAVTDAHENRVWAAPLIDCEGTSYQGFQIAAIVRSDAYVAYKAHLADLGKERD